MDDLDDVEVARLTTMASGALVTQILCAAASLGIADALGADTATTTELAERCGADRVQSLPLKVAQLGEVGLLGHRPPRSGCLSWHP